MNSTLIRGLGSVILGFALIAVGFYLGQRQRQVVTNGDSVPTGFHINGNQQIVGRKPCIANCGFEIFVFTSENSASSSPIVACTGVTTFCQHLASVEAGATRVNDGIPQANTAYSMSIKVVTGLSNFDAPVKSQVTP